MNTDYADRLALAVQTLIDRKTGAVDAPGSLIEGIWQPAETERRECCLSMVGSSNAHMRKHCTSVSHIARLYDVLPQDISAAIRRNKRG